MAAKRIGSFKGNTKDIEPYQLELESGETVSFTNPALLSAEQQFDLAESDSPRRFLQALLGDDFAAAWAEIRNMPGGDLAELINDVKRHFRVEG